MQMRQLTMSHLVFCHLVLSALKFNICNSLDETFFFLNFSDLILLFALF